MDAELLRQRWAAEQALEDPKPLYRFRVAALLAGEPIRCMAGDRVKVAEEEGRVLRVEETLENPELIHVRFFDDERIEQVSPGDLKILAPHRPGVLLGEDELFNRLEDEQQDAGEPRGLETLFEVARRHVKEAIPLVVRLFEQVEDAQNDDLRKALTKILRSRPYGEVEVALRHLGTHPADEDLVELPAMSAAATDPGHAKEILDRLEAMDVAQATRVVRRSGRSLVGAGGPAFATGAVRARVSSLTKEHEQKELRVALFVCAAAALMQEEDLVAAFASDSTEVRRAAVAELLRRGRTEPVLAQMLHEEDPAILGVFLRDAKGPLPLDHLRRLLGVARSSSPELLVAALIRSSEVREGKPLELLAPWLDEGQQAGMEAALWCAGLLGDPAAGDKIVKLLAKSKISETARPLALEALARLGHADAAAAFDAWGVSLIEQGTWGEEFVDTVGLLLGHEVDARELLGRYLVSEATGPVRRARALDVALHLVRAGQPELAEPARDLLPKTLSLPRFQPLVDALG